jgi:hypothetical protein
LAGVAEVLGVAGRIGVLADHVLHHGGREAHGAWTVVPDGLDGARTHLLEADHHHAVCSAVTNKRSGQVQTSGASRAGVVGVVDGNTVHAELIEDPLAAGGVSVAVAWEDVVSSCSCTDETDGVAGNSQQSVRAHVQATPVSTSS